MKKTIATLTLALMAWLPAHAEEVTSVNAVGMVRIEITRGQFSLVAMPFRNNEELLTVEEILGMDWPDFTTVYVWDAIEQKYFEPIEFRTALPPVRPEPLWNNDQAVIRHTTGFFISIPETAPQETYEIVLAGEVPDENQEIPLEDGFTLLGFSLPVEVSIEDESINLNPSDFDTIFYWDGLGYSANEYRSPLPPVRDGGWSDPDFTFKVGVGYFYQTSTPRPWEVVKEDFYVFP